MQIGSFTHPLAVLVQLLAIFWALRLIPLTGKAKAWLTFSVAFALMGTLRLHEWLVHTLLIESWIISHETEGIIALFISVLIALGVFQTREVFLERIRATSQLDQQLDELQRFQRLAVGRELRMKALKEENAALRDRLAAASPDKAQS